MNPHLIVVYKCVLAQSDNVLQQLSGRASDLRAVGSGLHSLSDPFFFVSEWKPFFMFRKV